MKAIIRTIAIAILSGITLAFNSPVEITGVVKDDVGNALQGVKITVSPTGKVSYTDKNGQYKILFVETDKEMVFEMAGFKTVHIKPRGRTIININLKTEKIKEDLILHEEAELAADDKVRPGLPIRGSKKMHAVYSIAGGAGNQAYTSAGWYNQNFNTEGYSTIHENGYKSVLNNPLSTFSIDVDRASYSNVRRFINQGQRPPVDAVRIEEIINYFKYDYPEPLQEHPFSVFTEIAECPWDDAHYLMHIGLKGKSIEKDKLPASNLVFLLDVSGSMNSPAKLPLLKNAFRLLVNEMRPEDRVSIVVYAGAAGVVLEPTPGNHKEKILQAIDRLSAGGSTAGGQGIILAYKLAAENYMEEGNNRIILATDGDFNIGASSNAEMERLIEKKREEGIFITVLGFGMGNYKDDKMEIIADKGNGNYAYIDNIQEARKTLVNEFGGTMFTIAKDVKFQIEFNPALIKSYRLIGYENRLLNDEDFNDDKKDAGEMGAGHTVTALYELVPAAADEEAPSIDPLKYQKKKNLATDKTSGEFLTLKLRYKKPDDHRSILMEIPFSAKVKSFDRASANLRFSAAVAGFGMLLRESEHKGNTDIDKVIAIAKNAKGEDSEGYKSEFIRLVKTVRDMNIVSENTDINQPGAIGISPIKPDHRK